MARKWSRGNRGAALVELAFALPLLIMLLVGMVSAGIAYNHQLALTHSAREGGRYAATLPVTDLGMDGWLTEIISQTVDDATGSLGSGVPGRYVCVAYVYPNGVSANDQTTRKVLDTSGLQPSETSLECYVGGDGRPDTERRVQVVVARETDFNAVVFSSTLTIDAEAVNRFEASP